MSKKVIKAALLGLGTVGSGVYKVLRNQKEEMPHKIGAVVRNRLNDKKYPCYTLLASRYCKHGLVIKEDN